MIFRNNQHRSVINRVFKYVYFVMVIQRLVAKPARRIAAFVVALVDTTALAQHDAKQATDGSHD